MFQVPWLPELVMSLHDYANFNAIFRGRRAVSCAYMVNLDTSLWMTALLPIQTHTQGARNKAAFPSDVIEAYKYTFSQPGALTAPLNYYRCMLQRRREMGKASAKKTIEVPTLIIWVSTKLARSLLASS